MNRATLTLKKPISAQRVIGQRVERFFRLDGGEADTDARTVSASLSSPTPVRRWFGFEVLEHSRQAVNLDRASPSLPLLFNHNPDSPIGSAEGVTLSGDRLRAVLRFARTERAEEIWQLVRDGHIRGVSIGYSIDDYTENGERDGAPLITVTRWTLFEASIATVAADDVGAGIGRSIPFSQTFQEKTIMPHEIEQARAAERQRVTNLIAAGFEFRNHGGEEMARELIGDPNANVETLRSRLADKLRAQKPTPTATAEPYGGGDHMMYGEGGRQILPVPKNFKGPNAERSAYLSGQWLRALYGKEDAQRWCRDNGHEIRAMSSAVLSQGGALAPDPMGSAIIDLADTFGGFRQHSDVWPMSSDSLPVPRSTADPEANFVGENDAIDEDEGEWDVVRLTAKKIGTIIRIPSELMEDSIIDLADRSAFQLARSFSKKEDQCGFIGDGSSTYGGMRGIFNLLVDGSHDAGMVSAAANHDTFAEIDQADLASLIATCPEYALETAKWYCSGKAWGLVFVRLMTGASGNAISDLANKIPKFYAGYPVVTSPVLPAGASTDYSDQVMIAFGDLRLSSKLGARREIRIQILTERYAEYDQVGVKGTERFHILNHDLGSNDEPGPVVGLIGG